MAGSRAPSGSLRKIADSVPKTGSKKNGIFGSGKPNAPKIKPNTFTGDDSDSDTSSSSDSDSNSGSDSDSKSEPLSDLQKRISQTPSKSKTNVKSKIDSKLATPAKSPTVNGLTASAKKGTSEKKVKKAESESSSSEEDEPIKKDNKGKKKAVKAESSSSESESEDSSASESVEATVPKRSATGGKAPVKKDDSSSESESESGPESESGSESESGESESEDDEDSIDAAQQIEEQLRNEVMAKSSNAAEKPGQKAMQVDGHVSENEDSDVEMMDQSVALTNGGSPTKVGSVPEFIAPDFHLRKLEDSPDASEVANFFSKAQMQGKQVWYITAPASLPITMMQDLTIPLDDADEGKPILTHNGEDYSAAYENSATSSSFRLLIPNKKGDEYSLHKRPVEKTMHITRSETFSPDGLVSVTTTQTVTTAKPGRPQPEGLRARYTPLGVASPKPTITMPPSTKKAATSVAEAASVPETSSKKKRKHRDDGEDGPIATASIPTPNRKDTPSDNKNSTAEKSTKKQKTSNEADRTSTPRRETPVPVPVPFTNGAYNSGSIPPAASQPTPRVRLSLSPGASLPATQVPIKRSPIPLPSILKTTTSGQSGSPSLSPEKNVEQPAKKVKKEKKVKIESDDSPVFPTPRKVSKIMPPQFDKSGRPIR